MNRVVVLIVGRRKNNDRQKGREIKIENSEPALASKNPNYGLGEYMVCRRKRATAHGGRRMKKIHKTITLDVETSKLAAKKTNFSQWVRDQLRSERNRREAGDYTNQRKLMEQERIEQIVDLSTGQLLHQLERKTDAEIQALIAILKMSQS